MNELLDLVRALEARVRGLELEQVRLHERLRNVGAALGGITSMQVVEAAPAESAAPKALRRSGETAKVGAKGAALPRRSSIEEGVPAGAAPAKTKKAAKKAAPGPSAKKAAAAGRSDGPRKWFEKGEAVQLFLSILKRPMRSGELMARVVAAKRKAQLPKQDLERFKWAVKAALKQAVRAQSIVRRGDGKIAAAAPQAPGAAKAARKAKK